MKTMKYFKRDERVARISLVLSVALVFNMVAPALVIAESNVYYSVESSLDSEKACTDDPIDTKNGNNYF